MASVKFLYGTKANYDALQVKDNDTLYFLTDTLQFFKGTSEYTKSVKNVSALPSSGQIQGVIYFRMTDYTMHIWNGTEFIQMNKQTVTQIPATGASDDNLPTTKAVADYVNAKDCSLNEKIGDKAQGVYGLVIAPLAQLPKNSRIDVKARYDMYQPNGKNNMQKTQYEAGLNFHIGKRISILTEYALVNDKTLAKHNYSMADAEVCFRF